MPQLTIRGIPGETVQLVSAKLIPELSQTLATSVDNFTLDLLCTTSYFLGEQVPTYPFVEIGWFDRGQAMQDKVAKIVTNAFVEAGVPALEVVFTIFEPSAYYADGEHY